VTAYYVPSTAFVESGRRVPDTHWRSASVFNLFRALIAGGLLLTVLLVRQDLFLEMEHREMFRWLTATYLALSIIYAFCLRARWPSLDLLLTCQVAGDVVVIVALMHLAGGFRSGIGVMLLPYLAAAGLISRGRMTLFHAAMASIALLLQQGYHFMTSEGNTGDFFPVGMLSIGCFATAWLAYRLASYASESQRLAERRGVDLANMAQINRLVIQDVSDGVLVLDARGIIRQFNQQAERLLGRGMMAGKTIASDFCPALHMAITSWQGGQTSTAYLELESTRRMVRPRFVPIRTVHADGGLVVFLEDIERLQREAQQLKLAALGRLTANIAHEIRNPLSAISHAAQLLGEEATDKTSLRLATIIHDNAQRLERMVREVLDLNRRDRAQATELRLHDWLAAFVEEFCEVEAIHAKLLLDCPQGAVVIFDEGQLHQVLWNLCRNGWRYCRKEDGSLRIVVASHSDAWVLEVRDDGPGVPEHLVPQLFEPFFTTDSKGTGLGLYIAREICAGNDSMLEYAPSASGGRFRIAFSARPA